MKSSTSKQQKVTKPAASTASTASSSSSGSLGHPCFECGLMFSKKTQYDQHIQLFHDPALDKTSQMCDECGATPDEAEQHAIEHDIGRIIFMLYLDVSREKQGLGSVLLPAAPLHPSLTAESAGSPRATPTPPPPSAGLDENSGTAGLRSGRGRPEPQSFSKSKRGRKRKSSIPPPSPSIRSNRSVSPAPSTSSLRSNRSSVLADRPPSKMARLAGSQPSPKGPKLVSPKVDSSKTQQIGDKCIFCGESLAKPWELVGHMVEAHNVRIEHIIKQEVSEMGEESKKYNRAKCPFCGTLCTDVNACLLHILESQSHRMTLFCSMSKGALCTIVLGLVDEQDKHYTITVRVKPKKT